YYFQREEFPYLPSLDHTQRILIALFRRTGSDTQSVAVNRRHCARARSSFATFDRIFLYAIDLPRQIHPQRHSYEPVKIHPSEDQHVLG
ncbi:MAG: hypothetical protein KDI27_09540, partial [Gammaproteobacteria bacterium]|nr:hypothetical protein [Gammaproteobacteria bacterium]